MNIIPHPEFLKKREQDLIEAESELSMRACELYLAQASLESQISNHKKRSRNYFITLLSVFLAGFLAGFMYSMISV